MSKNSKCKYYPCHKDMDDCSYCYCPVYPCGITDFGKLLEKPSVNGEKQKYVWDCSNCEILHKKENIDEITRFIFELVTSKIPKKE